jgi:hypothetical protein
LGDKHGLQKTQRVAPVNNEKMAIFSTVKRREKNPKMGRKSCFGLGLLF